MTTEIYKTIDEPFIAIIGIGNDSKRYIEEISSWDFPQIIAGMQGQELSYPESGIQMAILIVTDDTDAAVPAKSFKQADVLTVIVADREITADEDCYDSMTVVPKTAIPDTVRTITDIMIEPSAYTCLDLNDICYALRNSKNFSAFTLNARISNGGIEGLTSSLKEKLSMFPAFKKVLFKITIAEEDRQSLKIEHISQLADLFSAFPGNDRVIWGLNVSDKLNNDELRMSVLISNF